MKDMTASTKQITEGQINKSVADYRAMLEKHASQFSSEAVQIVLGQPELVKEQFEVFRRRVEMISNMIVRHVMGVSRNLKPQEVLKATGRNLYVSDDVVETMPKGSGAEADIIFFKLGRFVSDADLEKEYEQRGLVPADPYSLAKVNENDHAFADEHPNGTHWKDPNDNWCFVAFNRWDVGRRVRVSRSGSDWDGRWWFAGLRK
jgi:hypothetical protein